MPSFLRDYVYILHFPWHFPVSFLKVATRLMAISYRKAYVYPTLVALPYFQARAFVDPSEQTIVSTSPIASSLDPTNFEQPFAFEPKRWLGKNERDILEASQPFSLGPRGCLGRQ